MPKGWHLEELNDEQRVAATLLRGAICVQAGPGAGKTKTLIGRFHELLNAGIPLDQILCLTFTDAAADEMATRAGLGKGQRIFRTFHSFGFEIVQTIMGVQAAPDPRAWNKALYRLSRKYGLEKAKSLAVYISKQKRNGIHPQTALDNVESEQEVSYALAYREYLGVQKDEDWIDFDDMLVLPRNLLESSEGARQQFGKQAIQVDEAQDTDNLQWRLVQLLGSNVFFVGDPNQAIYEWRGADPMNMLHFTDWFPGGKFLYLGANYRSTKTIVDYCRKKAPIKNELIERLHSASGIVGPPIEYKCYGNPDDEAEAAVSMAIEDPEHSAILGRTNRLIATLQDVCEDTGKKYVLLGKTGYYQRQEVKHIMAYANFCVTGSDAALKEVIRTPFSPTRYMKKAELLKHLTATQEMQDEKKRLYDCLPGLQLEGHQRDAACALWNFLGDLRESVRARSASAALETIIARTDAANHYGEDDGDEKDNYALENVNNLPKRASRSATLDDFVEHVRKCLRSRKTKVGAITIGTIHQAKGKEWKNVCVIGAAEGMLPHKNGDPEEEERIFYVAISRPAMRLRITFAGTPSRFIADDLTDDVQVTVPDVLAKLRRAQAAVQLPMWGT